MPEPQMEGKLNRLVTEDVQGSEATPYNTITTDVCWPISIFPNPQNVQGQEWIQSSLPPINPAVSLKSLQWNCLFKKHMIETMMDGSQTWSRTSSNTLPYKIINDSFIFGEFNFLPCLSLLWETKCLYFPNHLEDSFQKAWMKKLGGRLW